MIAPRGHRPTPPTRTPPFIGGDGPLGIGLTGKLAALDLGDMGGKGLGLLVLLIRMGLGMALGQLCRIHGHKPDRRQGDVSLAIFNLDLACHTAAVPSPWGIQATLAWFLKQQGQRHLLLTPRLHLLANGASTGTSVTKPIPVSRHSPKVRGV